MARGGCPPHLPGPGFLWTVESFQFFPRCFSGIRSRIPSLFRIDFYQGSRGRSQPVKLGKGFAAFSHRSPPRNRVSGFQRHFSLINGRKRRQGVT